MSEDVSVPIDGHWWEWRPGYGWVMRAPVEEPTDQREEPAA